jgi:diketogulonate reductase-like aldo/keto reductase
MRQATIGFGTYRLDPVQAYDATICALHTGYTHLDTAPLYRNQAEIGMAIHTSGVVRSNLHITAKISRNELKKGQIRESFQNTLATMRLDYVDLLLLHEPINCVKNWELLCELYHTEARGRIGQIGVSNFSQSHLEQITRSSNLYHTMPSANQIEINPFLGRGTLPCYCQTNGIQIIAHSPLAKAEKFDDLQLQAIASQYNTGCAQIMLGWGVGKGYDVIPRSSDPTHIADNLARIHICPDDMAQLDRLDCGYATHPKYIVDK